MKEKTLALEWRINNEYKGGQTTAIARLEQIHGSYAMSAASGILRFGALALAMGVLGMGDAGCATTEPAMAQNILPNPSFEEVEKLAGWETHVWAGEGRFGTEANGRNGGCSVMIASEKGGDLSWRATVEVRPDSVYRLSGWIKTENVSPKDGAGALLNVHEIKSARTRALKGTKDWTEVETTFKTGSRREITVNCLLGGWGLATGTVWFDDVSLELVSTKKTKKTAMTVTIDASKTSAPISKYIYGQFIEHLGRCIYGGIWAEMLEDRKFYYTVGASGSAWRAIGDPGRVKMMEEDPYVGAHTPCVQLAGDGTRRGIVQGALALIEGKEYVGRIVLAGDAEAAPVEVSLVWGDGPEDRAAITVGQVSGQFAKTPLRFVAGGASEEGRLEIASGGKGAFSIGTVSLMPADNVDGMRADTLALLKELDSPVYRWPGGNFVSGYDWRDGIGERDRRPPRKNPAWRGIEHNDFGLDEYVAFCREIATEPFITVNSGLGNVDEAVEELQYANGAPDTPMGKLRAGNGHPEAYGVEFWAIGNEMYGGWQLGQTPLEFYTKKHNEFAIAMRAEDPGVQLVAVGATGKWSEGMLADCADHMDLLSEHFYCRDAKDVVRHVRFIPDAVAHKARFHRRYQKEIPALEGKSIPIALDEWNYWYGPELYGEIGVRYFLKDALGVAAGLHEFFRNSDIFFMANYAQTVNVIGAIKTSKTAAEFDTTGLALKLYRAHYGCVPVKVTADCAPMDVAAAWNEERTALTLGVVNPTDERQTLAVDFSGVSLADGGRAWRIAGTDPMAYNEPGVPPRVRIVEGNTNAAGSKFEIEPLSVVVYELPVE